MRGDWADAVADADAVLAGPSAPLARTWPHLVRGLVALRRGGDADADLDEAWQLARRFGEPIRLLPAAAALVERSWLPGRRRRPSRRVPGAAGRRRRAPASSGRAATSRPGSAGSTPTSGPDRPWTLGPAAVAEPYRLQLAGRFDDAATTWATLSAPYDQALALVDAGDAGRARAPGSTCSTGSAPTGSPARSARTCGAAAPRRIPSRRRRADAGEPGRAHQPPDRDPRPARRRIHQRRDRRSGCSSRPRRSTTTSRRCSPSCRSPAGATRCAAGPSSASSTDPPRPWRRHARERGGPVGRRRLADAHDRAARRLLARRPTGGAPQAARCSRAKPEHSMDRLGSVPTDLGRHTPVARRRSSSRRTVRRAPEHAIAAADEARGDLRRRRRARTHRHRRTTPRTLR